MATIPGSPQPERPGTASTPGTAPATQPTTTQPVTQPVTQPATRPVAAGAPDTERRHAATEERHVEDRHAEERRTEPVAAPTDPARDKFGGVNLGACIFGWLVAVGVTVILVGVLGAVVTAVTDRADLTQSDAERAAGTIGLASAIALLVVLVLGYYAGGYVAGRMSRFDGGRQGVAVWFVGLVVTAAALATGAIFGDQYNVLDRVDLPRLYLSDDQLGWGIVATGVALLVGTLLAAYLGGKVGRHYHQRVDKALAKRARR